VHNNGVQSVTVQHNLA